MLSAMRAIICTASTGYLPTEVSPESITASLPSRMALATSEASARVGRGCSIMDCSICVAVMTGFPRQLQRRMISFCARGTRSGAVSTPKSPRATITASDASTMFSRSSSASGFSILATRAGMRWGFSPGRRSLPAWASTSRWRRSSSMSLALRTKESAR